LVYWQRSGGESTQPPGKALLTDGVSGDGVRTVALYFKSTAELIQVVCLAQVVSGFGRF